MLSRAVLVFAAVVLFSATPSHAQDLAIDSMAARQLVTFYGTETYLDVACLAVHAEKSMWVIDSVTAIVNQPPCPHPAGIAGNLAPEFVERGEQFVLRVFHGVMAANPDLAVVCGIRGVGRAQAPSGRWHKVPLVWCLLRTLPSSPQS